MSLNITSLQFRYKPNRPLIEGLSLHVAKGEVVAITGASGCGKSTLLQLILGFLKPSDGTIQFGNQTLVSAQAFCPPEQRHIGMVFQDYALFPHLTVRENIGFGLRQGHHAAKAMRIDELLRMFDLSDVAFYYPHQLSGGQMQRVAIARALAPAPSLLLLDEPFSNLDATLTARLRTELKPLFKSLHMAIILVTHHREDAAFLADRIVTLSDLMVK
jgi:iron(III) transport system ATP-binding protein